MSEKVNWSYLVHAASGPQIAAAAVIEVDAYDKFDLTIATGVTQTVDLVPSGGAVKLLVLNPDEPDPELSYAVGGKDIPLDAPHVLLGAGAVSLLGTLTALTFKNATQSDITLQIIVGRDATP
jgi:hypothetical protein